MAQIYTICCPKCSKEYESMKGILMSEAQLDPIPEERSEDTPAVCPYCGFPLNLEEDASQKHILQVMFAD